MSSDAEVPADRAPLPGTPLPGRVLLEARFDARSLFTLRSAVAAHAEAAGLSRQQAYDVTAVAHELAANAVRHGAGHGQLRLTDDNGSLCCQVTDPGPARTAPVPADGLPWPAEHGHGLWIACQATASFTIQHGPGGTTATARFPPRPPAPGQDGQPPAPASLPAPPPGFPPLTIGVREDPRWTTVLVEGHLDYLTRTDLVMVLGGLISAGKLAIAVDLSRAALADSSGTRCLLRAARQVRARDGQLVIIDNKTTPSPDRARLRDLAQSLPVLPTPPG